MKGMKKVDIKVDFQNGQPQEVEIQIDGGLPIPPDMDPIQFAAAVMEDNVQHAQAQMPSFWRRFNMYRGVMIWAILVCIVSVFLGWWASAITNIVVFCMLFVVDYQTWYYQKNKINLFIHHMNNDLGHVIEMLKQDQIPIDPANKKNHHKNLLRAGMEEQQVAEHDEGVAAIQAKYQWLKKQTEEN